jgi:uncharacterized protein (TIGR02217 family)
VSSEIFPALPGVRWGRPWRPDFGSTIVQRSVSGNEARVQLQSYPLWNFELAYDLLRADATTAELQKVMGFFLRHGGDYESWLFDNPDDRTAAAAQPIGTGNGVQTQFQLARRYGFGANFITEPVQNVGTLGTVRVNGTAQTLGVNFTVSTTGLVTFAAAPANGAGITWDPGTFYYRCRFASASLDTEKFAVDLFELKRVRFVGALGNKVL